MTDLIIPVRTPLLAKQRLANLLSPEQRAGLVLAMLQDLLETLASIPELTVQVVSGDHGVGGLARRNGVSVIPETAEGGYNAAVETGFLSCSDNYRHRLNVAVVPGDVPLASSADLRWLVAGSDPEVATVRLLPSHDEGGTNGLFLSTADLLQPAFGADSFRRYRQMARSRGIQPEIRKHSTLALDIDTTDDLARFHRCNSDGATGRYLRDLYSGLPLADVLTRSVD